jgi:hypothetical protein
MEAAQGRKSPDLSGPQSGMPAGTIPPHAHVVPPANAATKHRFSFQESATRGFLKWLREFCPSGVTAQVKGEKLMLAPETSDGFRATVTALRSLDGGKGVSFHAFSLPEDRSVRLQIKNVGKSMPESAVQEELSDLGINVQGVMQLRSGRRDQDAAKDRPLTPHFIMSVLRGPDVTRMRSRRTSHRRARCKASAANASAIRSYAPRRVACGGGGGGTNLVVAQPPGNS